MITLRPDDQIPTQSALRGAFASGRRSILLQGATGFGKTVLAAAICEGALAKGRSVIFSTPRIQLNRQAENTFAEFGLTDVHVSTKQTLLRRDWQCDLMIDDEAHYGMSDAWIEKLRQHLARGGWLLGLSASPVAGMSKIYQDVVKGPSVSWLMEHGHLSRYRAFGPTTPDLSQVPIVAGDYQKSSLAETMNKSVVTGDAVRSWLQLAKGKRTVGYCVSRQHSRDTVAQFLASGIRAEHIDGNTPQDERDRIINRFADRETEWLGTVGLVTLGFDMSSQVGRDVPIEAMQDLAPTRALPRHVQKLGRVIRKKDYPAIIIDNAGNLSRLGFPDDDFEFSIETGTTRKAQSALAVSICKFCFAAFKTAPTCPYCFAERELTPREIEIREGELRELERVQAAKVKRVEQGMARDIDSLAMLAAQRGFKSGWLVHMAKHRNLGHVSFDKAERLLAQAKRKIAT